MVEGEEDVQIGDCRVWSETGKGGEWICEGESTVNWFEYCYYYCIIISLFVSVCHNFHLCYLFVAIH